VAQQLAKSERNFSDIDLIYERNARQSAKKRTTLNDDELADLFDTLREKEDLKKKQ
jgi:hypothetical protein